MGEFKRGISRPNMEILAKLAGQDSWWRDVLMDRSLLIGIRNEYLNVYWHGQSIFRVAFRARETLVSTHPKYLLNPDVSSQISLKDGMFQFGANEAAMLTRKYKPGETLGKLKRAAKLFSGEEKQGVHQISTSNFSVIDVEIALQANDVSDVGSLPRVDIAAFEDGDRGDGVNLTFWEAKTLANPELRSKDKKNGLTSVVSQIKKYQTMISKYGPQICKSYGQIAQNFIEIEAMSEGHRKISTSVKKVARDPAILSVDPLHVGLIVYGYDADHAKGQMKPLRDRLEIELAALGLAKDRLRFKGDPKGLKL